MRPGQRREDVRSLLARRSKPGKAIRVYELVSCQPRLRIADHLRHQSDIRSADYVRIVCLDRRRDCLAHEGCTGRNKRTVVEVAGYGRLQVHAGLVLCDS